MQKLETKNVNQDDLRRHRYKSFFDLVALLQFQQQNLNHHTHLYLQEFLIEENFFSELNYRFFL